MTVSPQSLPGYFAQVPAYSQALDEHKARTRRWLPWALGLALVANAGQAVHTMAIYPLKETVYIPTVIHEDGSAVVHLSVRDLSVKERQAAIRGQLQRYIHCREGYDYGIGGVCYRTIRAMSTGAVMKEYDAEFDYQKNPKSVQNLIGKLGKVDAEVIDVQSISDGVFSIPYRRSEVTRYGQAAKVTYWTATVQIELIDQISDNNSIGVIVTSYNLRRDTPPNENRTSP
jgi:type IV secretory pathway component VirB8